MKHVICLAVASLIATSANAAEMKWNGSAGWRYEQTNTDTSLTGNTAANRARAHGLRANLGVSGGWENVEWGVGVRTGGTTAINDDHVALVNNQDRAIGFEQAWFRYVRDFGSLDLAATVGRQKNVFAYDTISQTLFDNDVRFDGLGWQFKFGMFGFNAAQYVLGGQTGKTGQASNKTNNDSTDANPATAQRLNYLFGFQPTMNWKFSDDIEAMFGVGYYIWKDQTQGNAIGGTASNFNMENPRQWQFTTSWTLPYNLSFHGEYVMNKKQKFDANTRGAGYAATQADVSRSAWSAGLTYGSLKKAHDFSIGYAYGQKGLGSVINAYSYEKFTADNKGHTVEVAYAIADNFHLGWKGLFLKEKEKLDPATGAAYTAGNANREFKTNYWEVTAGVMF